MNDVPLWRRIHRDLDAQIRKGTLRPGDRLPPEDALAARYGVHRHTVRRALQRLREQGVILAEQGRGTFVREPVTVHPMDLRSRLSETARRANRNSLREVLGTRRVRADATLASLLRVIIGAPLRQIDTLHRIDGTPAVVTSHYYPLPRFDGIEREVAALGSITAAFARFGVADLRHLASRISARPAAPRDARLLSQPASRPVLHVVNVSTDAQGVPVQLTRGRFAAARVELLIRHMNDEF